MDISGYLKLAKENIDSEFQNFTGFFKGFPIAEGNVYSNIAVSSLLYLVIGVTLQDSFISGLKTSDIGWLDRAISQIVFWVSIALVAQVATSWVDHSAVHGQAFAAIFRVMPIAFLCGSYAASIGYFIDYVFRIILYQNFEIIYKYPIMPSWFNIFVQIGVISAFLPRELRKMCRLVHLKSIIITIIILSLVLTIDLVAMFGPDFLPEDVGVEGGAS